MLLNKRNIRRGGLTDSQRRNVYRIIVILVVVVILWLLFAPGMGIISLYHKKSEQYKTEKEISRLEKENIRVGREIDKLNNDPHFLEEEARKKGYLKENERVFDFGKK